MRMRNSSRIRRTSTVVTRFSDDGLSSIEAIFLRPSINVMLSATSAEPNIYRTEMIFSRPNAQQAPPQPAAGNDSAHSMTARRFPPPRSVEESDPIIVRDCPGYDDAKE